MDEKSPYDPELRPILEKMVSLGATTTFTLEILPKVRQGVIAMSLTDEQLRRDGKIDIAERKVCGAENASEISLLICRPSTSTIESNALLPCMYFIHGGGMVVGSNQTPSSHQYDGISTWNRQSNLFAWTALLGDQRGSPNVSPYAAPSRAQDLSNLPPAFIDIGSADIFRDEIIDYAQRNWYRRILSSKK